MKFNKKIALAVLCPTFAAVWLVQMNSSDSSNSDISSNSETSEGEKNRVSKNTGSDDALANGLPSNDSPYAKKDPSKASVRLAALNHEALTEKAEQISNKQRYRFATARPVDVAPHKAGTWNYGKKMSTWKLPIQSEGADSVNLAFTDFHLPTGSTLKIQDKAKRFAPIVFTDADNEEHRQLWTPLFRTDEIDVELEVPTPLIASVSLHLTKVNHGFRSPSQSLEKKVLNTSAASGTCNIDVVCTAADNADYGHLVDQYRDEIRSVGAYTVSGVDTCTGTLLNNTSNDQTPYFLTADHCGVGAAEAPSVVVYWNFENSFYRIPGSVENGQPGDGPITMFNTGAIFRSEYANSDMTLLQLDDPVDASHNPYFAGWDRSGVDVPMAVAIHHPSVSEKRISFELDTTSTTTYSSNTTDPNGTHIRISDWNFGTTEPGSSGSGLFDNNGRIIGQLHGGGAACGNDEPDWYGRLFISWNGGGTDASRLSNWLDSTSTGATFIDGINSQETITISGASVNEGDSGTTSVDVDLTLSPAVSDTVTVGVVSQNDTAFAGSDYVAVDELVTFAPGETSKTISVTINGDTDAEQHESFRLVLQNPTNAAVGGPATVTILNDDFVTPSINSDLSASAAVSQPFEYQITALNTATSYSIQNAPAGMTVDPGSGIISWTPSAVGNFTVDLVATNSAGSDTKTLAIEVLESLVPRAIDQPSFSVINGGNGTWTEQANTSRVGGSVAVSGAITDSQTSAVSVTIEGERDVTFDWSVSSEGGFDFLRCYLNGAQIQEITGNVDWTQVSVSLPAGTNTLTWSYEKDASVSEGSDRGFVDNLQIIGVSDLSTSGIGSPAIAGETTGTNGSYSATGSGTDIWGDSDKFYFSHETMTGDGYMIAKIDSITSDIAWAKAGIAVREGLDEGSRGMSLFSRATGSYTYLGSRRFVDGLRNVTKTGGGQKWLRIRRRGNVLAASLSFDGVIWFPYGQPVTYTDLADQLYFGLAVTSADETKTATAEFSNVQVTSFPANLVSVDIDSPSTAGSYSYDSVNSTHTVSGSGKILWEAHDQYHYAYQYLEGDGVAQVKIDTIDSEINWATAGIMFRENLGRNRRNFGLQIRKDFTRLFRVNRETVNIGPTVRRIFDSSVRYLRIERSGDTFTASYSANGSTWTQFGDPVVMPGLTSELLVGLMASSPDATKTTTARFSEFQVTGNVASPAPATKQVDGELVQSKGKKVATEIPVQN